MKPFIRSLTFSALLLLSQSGQAQFLASSDSAPAEKPSTVNRAVLLQLVNAVRSKGRQCGDTYYYAAPPIRWNETLEKAATQHSADMDQHHFFSHTAPDGSRAGERLDRIGYAWKTYGENIGEGYTSEKDMIRGWLSSPGHCKNIMNKDFKEMGVARVGNLWTQEFGSR